MNSLIFVDIEAAEGPTPFSGRMTEFGAVEFKTRKKFYGRLWETELMDPSEGGLFRITSDTPSCSHRQLMADFANFARSFEGRPIFISDNPAFDFMWIAYEFDKWGMQNPFGYSGRRIGDLFAGASGKWKNTSKWKKWRTTNHDHNPVHDALGNAEAFATILEKFELS